MGAAIGDILGLAAGVAVSPLPIVAMILLLATPRGRGDGILFGAGWLAAWTGCDPAGRSASGWSSAASSSATASPCCPELRAAAAGGPA